MPVIFGSTPVPMRFAVAENVCELPAVIDCCPVAGKRAGFGDVTSTFASVNVVVAVPEEPVAVTAYVATNQSGRLNESLMLPPESAVTSTLRDQVWPWSSLTLMFTDSPACQPEPVSVTSSPGA